MKAGQEQLQPESMELNEPSSNDYAYRPLTTKHRRAGSTGTTGDEEYTTDEDELYTDETDGAIVASTGLYPQHPFFKSDLTRAATDLFGYASKREHDNKEPTSLFDEEDNAKFILDNQRSDTSKSSSLFTFNEKLNNVSSRRQKSLAIANQDKLMSVDRAESSVNNTQQENIKEVFASQTLDDKLSSKVQQVTESEEQTDPSNQNCCNSSSNTQKTIIVPEPETTSFSNGSQETATTESPHPASAVSTRSTTSQWDRTAAEVKEHAVIKLEEELRKAHEELKLKDEEVSRLSRIRQDVETELEELTASLFQEAHNMVREANTRQATAERLLEESRMKAEVLAAEVAALKTLVLTSTPARPNPHLHPQIDTEGQQGLFTKKHRRSPSHFNLKYGRESSPGSPDSPVREQRSAMSMSDKDIYEGEWQRDKEKEKDFKDMSLEVDPRLHNEFLRWKANPRVDKSDPFVARIFREDIDLCLDFPSKELTAKVRQAVLDGIIFIEAASDKTKLSFPKKCALLEAPRQCHYRMRLGDQENQWHCISKICRNRIIAVCDFLNYLRYIERGLVKSSIHDIYWEITRLRKEMVLARLGLALST